MKLIFKIPKEMRQRVTEDELSLIHPYVESVTKNKYTFYKINSRNLIELVQSLYELGISKLKLEEIDDSFYLPQTQEEYYHKYLDKELHSLLLTKDIDQFLQDINYEDTNNYFKEFLLNSESISRLNRNLPFKFRCEKLAKKLKVKLSKFERSTYNDFISWIEKNHPILKEHYTSPSRAIFFDSVKIHCE